MPHRKGFWDHLLSPIEKVDQDKIQELISQLVGNEQAQQWKDAGLYAALDNPANPLVGPVVNDAADMLKAIFDFLGNKKNK